MKVVHLVESISRNAAGLSESVRWLSLGLSQNAKTDVSVIAFRDEFTDVDLSDWLPLQPRILSRLHLGFGFIYGMRGRRLVETNFSLLKITADMKAVYEWVLGGGNKPNCVVVESKI